MHAYNISVTSTCVDLTHSKALQGANLQIGTPDMLTGMVCEVYYAVSQLFCRKLAFCKVDWFHTAGHIQYTLGIKSISQWLGRCFEKYEGCW